ncbi:MAG: GntR family transcriptional regulator [Peptococcaceae bacterium]|nr:GntR family transcriptional regulator [Peptococcaceae bacterium]
MEGKVRRNETLDQQVYKILRDAFAKGEFKQGDRLVESAIAEQLGISRTPVREAIRKLEIEGLVVRGNAGVFVNIPCRADIAEVYAARAHLEGLAAHIAANSAAETDLVQIKKVLKLEEEVRKDDIPRIIELDERFHRLLVKTSRNKKLIAIIDQLEVFTPENERLAIFSDWRDYQVTHKEIYQAIINRDAHLAEELAKKHIIDTGFRIYEKLTHLRQGDFKHTPTKFYLKNMYQYYFGKEV